jgi:hypothetical protein
MRANSLGVQRLLNLNDVIRLLRSEVTRAGSQRAFARKAGVNVSVVSKTLRGMVLPSEKILSALKLHIVYLSNDALPFGVSIFMGAAPFRPGRH